MVSGILDRHLSLLYVNKKDQKAHYFETAKEKVDEPFTNASLTGIKKILHHMAQKGGPKQFHYQGCVMATLCIMNRVLAGYEGNLDMNITPFESAMLSSNIMLNTMQSPEFDKIK